MKLLDAGQVSRQLGANLGARHTLLVASPSIEARTVLLGVCRALRRHPESEQSHEDQRGSRDRPFCPMSRRHAHHANQHGGVEVDGFVIDPVEPVKEAKVSPDCVSSSLSNE